MRPSWVERLKSGSTTILEAPDPQRARSNVAEEILLLFGPGERPWNLQTFDSGGRAHRARLHQNSEAQEIET